jgi:hypothetical protein
MHSLSPSHYQIRAFLAAAIRNEPVYYAEYEFDMIAHQVIMSQMRRPIYTATWRICQGGHQ